MLVSATGAPRWNEFVCGEVCNADTDAHALPNVAAELFEVQAKSDNAGNVYLGKSTATLPDGATDTTTGLEFAPGQSRYVFVPNLSALYLICASADDGITYLGYR